MFLKDYISAHHLTQAEFGLAIGVSQAAVDRYCRGVRTPKKPILNRIKAATQGLVTANDFQEIPDLAGGGKAGKAGSVKGNC